MVQVRIPLRSQIIGLVAGALTASLMGYVFMGSELIVRDKTTYIYDYCFSQVRWVAETLETGIFRVTENAGPIPRRADRAFTESWQRILRRSEIRALAAISWPNGPGSAPAEKITVLRSNVPEWETSESIRSFLSQAGWTTLLSETGSRPRLALEPGSGQMIVAVPVPGGAWLARIALPEGTFDSGKKDFSVEAVDTAGLPAMMHARSELAPAPPLPAVPREEWEALVKSEFPSGVREMRSDRQSYLVGYERLRGSGYYVLYWVPKDVAFQAARTLARTALLMGICILLLTTGITLVLIQRIVHRIDGLVEATERVALGNFSEEVPSQSLAQDEVSILASSFNSMSRRIQALLLETAGKARMETELETAKLVQETFFPAARTRLGPFEIAGMLKPASECGGDWWYYGEIQGKLFVWLGDATGHGVPAALITSAMRASAAIVEQFGLILSLSLKPSQVLSLLTRTIEQTSQGKMQMTLVLACLDPKTGELTYSNAGQTNPCIIRKTGGPGEPSPSQLLPLTLGKGPALGYPETAGYEDAKAQLLPGDFVVFYSDGISELRQSPDNKRLNNKRINNKRIKEMFQRGVESAETAEQALESIQAMMREHGLDEAKEDDVTVCVCRYLGAEPTAEASANAA